MKKAGRHFALPTFSPRETDRTQCTLLLSPSRSDADQQDTFESVRAMARAYGLTVKSPRVSGPPIARLAGSRRSLQRAVAHLHRVARNGAAAGDALSRSLRALAPKVVAAVARRHGVMRSRHLYLATSPGEAGLFTAPMLSKGYDFPDGDGAGQRIALLMLAGGLSQEWLERGAPTYFGGLGRGFNVPKIEVHRVGDAVDNPAPLADVIDHVMSISGGQKGPPAHQQNHVGRAARSRRASKARRKARAAEEDSLSQIKWTAEAIMEIELIGGIANGATIALYILQDSADDIHDAIVQAVNDRATVICCSFGAAEQLHDPGEIPHINAALEYAREHQVTFCAASGDTGAAGDPGAPDELAVDFPASSPWAIAVGGTKLGVTEQGIDFDNEIVWKETKKGIDLASGGGFSTVFPVPSWQQDVGRGSSMRGVPDVAAPAALASGCWLWFGDDTLGVNTAAAGTSSAVPVWSALVALLNQNLGYNLGHVTPLLYDAPAGFVDIDEGDNFVGSLKRYEARTGWDPCTGLGRPRGKDLLEILRQGADQGRKAAGGGTKRSAIRGSSTPRPPHHP